MIRTVVLFCLAAICVANPLLKATEGQELDPHIVGGVDADIKYYPYQVSLVYSNSHICGASIIKVSWALSAAHCMTYDRTKYSIRAGSSFRTSGGTMHSVSKVISHKLYNSNSNDYDFALLKVSTPFTFRSGVAAIQLPSQGQSTAANSNAYVSGWGTLSSSGISPNQLQVVIIPVTSQATCQAAYGVSAITARMICAGRTQGGVDSCQGDSGGPMVVNNELVGVVSWGQGCALPGKPGVYAKVSSVRDWIDATAAATSVNPVNLLATLCLVVAVVVGQSHG